MLNPNLGCLEPKSPLYFPPPPPTILPTVLQSSLKCWNQHSSTVAYYVILDVILSGRPNGNLKQSLLLVNG